MRHILIDKEQKNAKKRGYGFPWKYDAPCYNFRTPDEAITPDKIDGIKDKYNIETLVIACDLPDYVFLEGMTGLRYLYIYTGENIHDLSFLKSLNNLSRLLIAKSHVESLEPLVELIQEMKRLIDAEKDVHKRLLMGLDAICIQSDRELDGTILKKHGLYIGV